MYQTDRPDFRDYLGGKQVQHLGTTITILAPKKLNRWVWWVGVKICGTKNSPNQTEVGISEYWHHWHSVHTFSYFPQYVFLLAQYGGTGIQL